MGEEMPETPTAARRLAWATAVLLVFGVVSAAVIDVRDGAFDADVVSAAGGNARTVEVPFSSTTTTTTTVSSLPPRTSAQRPAIARSTTVPNAAAAVLAAIRSSAPPTTPLPTPPTTQPPPATTPTTGPPVTPATIATTTTSIPATTTTTVPGRAAVTLANLHPNAFVVRVGGREFELDPGEEVGPVDVALPAEENDVVEVRAMADPTCALTETRDLFQPGGRHRLAIVAAEGVCGSTPNFELKVTAA